MAKLTFTTLLLLLSFADCKSQNLVPNGDFEQYTSCPTSWSQLTLTIPWMNPSTATPDYLNECSAAFNVSVPENHFGYQQAHSGNGYIGIDIFTQPPYVPNYRENIEVLLTSSLVVNSCYHFEMYVSHANQSQFSTDDIGVYFSDTAIAVSNYNPLPFIPQINNSTGYIIDTLNWILISGDYFALGGENYLTIGNFENDSNTSFILTNSSGSLEYAYYYIDDVSLIQILPCNTGINEPNKNIIINLFPNPALDKLNITISNNELSEIILYDITSRKFLQQKFTSSVSLNTRQLAKGIYIYEVKNKNGVIKKGKVVKE